MLEHKMQCQDNIIHLIKCNSIIPNPYQMRKNFDEQALIELSENIKQYGVIQPIIVCQINANNYQLIAGERRLRASKLASLEHIPAIIKQLDNQQKSLIALIENIQRQELNPIEEAYAFLRLHNEFGLTHEQIAQQAGKSRSHITNLLRLINLSSEVKSMLLSKQIDMGHARALVVYKPHIQLQLANLIIKHNWSVRDIENYLKKENQNLKQSKYIDNDIANLQEQLTNKLGLKVTISNKNNRGSININYSGLEDFDYIITQLNK